MTALEQQTVIESYIAAYNRFDLEGMLATLHEAVEFTNISGAEVTATAEGKAAFRELAVQGAALFSTRQQTITAWTLGEVVSIAIDYKAVLAVDLANGLKRGDTLRLQGTSEFIFQDGLIVRLIDRS